MTFREKLLYYPLSKKCITGKTYTILHWLLGSIIVYTGVSRPLLFSSSKTPSPPPFCQAALLNLSNPFLFKQFTVTYWFFVNPSKNLFFSVKPHSLFTTYYLLTCYHAITDDEPTNNLWYLYKLTDTIQNSSAWTTLHFHLV